MRRSGATFPGRRFSLKSFQDLASGDDQLIRAAQHFAVNNLVDPVAALAGAEAELTLPRRCEEQAVPVEAPAAEYASDFQPVDGRQRILSVDADLVLNLAHTGRLAPRKTCVRGQKLFQRAEVAGPRRGEEDPHEGTVHGRLHPAARSCGETPLRATGSPTAISGRGCSSARTAEYHLRKAFAKPGISSRAELRTALAGID
jgi:hypothetical protein